MPQGASTVARVRRARVPDGAVMCVDTADGIGEPLDVSLRVGRVFAAIAHETRTERAFGDLTGNPEKREAAVWQRLLSGGGDGI